MFTMVTPKQASLKESIITVKYWSNYASSLFCEWKCFNGSDSHKQEGYHTVKTDLTSADEESEAEDVMNSNLEENSENETNSTTEIRNMVT